jgi:methionyl-tRNA formyltransferase
MTKPSPLRLVFAGTPEFAARHLSALLDSRHEIQAVYTQPDRRAGRGKKLSASPVKNLAVAAGLPVHQPASLRDPEAQAELAKLQADVLIVVAYGLILPQAVLDIPRLGCINVHASLLPRWRGAAPIQRAIEAGDEDTGITIMQMDAGLDTGPMLARAQIPIESGTNAAILHDKLAALGSPLLLDVLTDLRGHIDCAQVQTDEGATYAHKLDKAEASIDWSQDAEVLLRRILAFNPFPVCWTSVGDTRVKVWDARLANQSGRAGEIIATTDAGLEVACGSGSICLTRLQLPGGKALATNELLNARREMFSPGMTLGE